MREFLLNSESTLDQVQVDCVNSDGQSTLLSCRWIHFNDRIKLFFFPENCVSLSRLLPESRIDEVCMTAKRLLDEVIALEAIPELTLENMVWDIDAIYLDEETGALRMLYLPIIAEDDVRNSGIYVKRVYAVIEEMLERIEGGEDIIRQIEFQKEREMGNWILLQEALDRRMPTQSESIRLVGIENAKGLEFKVGRDTFRIGSDPELADAVIDDPDQVRPVQAVIGWNEISFYVTALESRSGTYLNNTYLTFNTQTPIGAGSVIRVAEYAFLVEA